MPRAGRPCMRVASARCGPRFCDECPQGRPAQAHLGVPVRLMSAMVRYVGDVIPVGQVVFFRSAFAIIPVVVIYAWRRELAAALRTSRPFGHFGRGADRVGGMFFNFAALARLPIVDVTTITLRVAADHGRALGLVPEGARAHLSLERGRGRLRRRDRDAVAAPRSRALHRRRLIGCGVRRAVRARRCLHQRGLGGADAPAHRYRDDLVDRALLLAVLHRRRTADAAVRLDRADRAAARRAGRASA